MKDVVDLSPPYQREGSIWRPEDRKYLIDSIINGLDIPKLYFEAETTHRRTPQGLRYQYAVIDGKQRLEAIIQFLSGNLSLDEHFIFFEDDSVSAGGMTLESLLGSYPMLAQRFLDYNLPIVRVDSDSGDLIEEMFLRLNASFALNNAELRNAISGQARDSSNRLGNHTLLVERSPIRNARYKHRELAAKFLSIEHQISTRGRITDTKAGTLRKLFEDSRYSSPLIDEQTILDFEQRSTNTLDSMTGVFRDNDPLLGSIGTVVVYYISFRDNGFVRAVKRHILEAFESFRREAARMVEESPDYDRPAYAPLRKYHAYVQSTNDGGALHYRARVLIAFVTGYKEEDPLAGLDAFVDTATDEPEGTIEED